MSRKRLRAIFFGPHGSGKRTQAERLAKAFGVPVISVGYLLQDEIREGTSIGKLMREYVELGMLVPDDLVNPVILRKIRRLVAAEKDFILEGFPRNVDQAAALEKVARVQVAIHLKMSDEDAAVRVEGRRECASCKSVFHLEADPPGPLETCRHCGSGLQGRPTDQRNAFYSRQAIYHFMTEPLVSFYRQKGVLLSIKADQPIESLETEIVRKMKRLGF
ncbi:nucleoside monophosphate kinase [Patescibacteria group bacterium]|nr:nucleoside monophosphate kinase [Patescibacteria group bacterium]